MESMVGGGQRSIPCLDDQDGHNLEHLSTAKRLCSRQARRALFFTCFNFTVTYRPGSKNDKAVALSRQHESMPLPKTDQSIISPTLILAPVQFDMTEVREAQSSTSTKLSTKSYTVVSFISPVLAILVSQPKFNC